MALDINAIKGRLNKLQNTQRKSDLLWKPKPGKTQVRIVPYKFSPENPFIELYFHYNLNNKTYLSPISFDRPDPIVEFAEKLKRTGDQDDWKAAKAMEPKLRTFVPIIVRKQEEKGVQFWGFGKTVYQEILGYIADPDYGDITDPKIGRDITIDYVSAEDGGTSYPTTTIRVKPNTSLLTEDKEKLTKFLDGQTAITELYSELSYDELKNILEGWLNPEKKDDIAPKSMGTIIGKTPVAGNELSGESETRVEKTQKVTEKSLTNKKAVETAFDDLFKKKE